MHIKKLIFNFIINFLLQKKFIFLGNFFFMIYCLPENIFVYTLKMYVRGLYLFFKIFIQINEILKKDRFYEKKKLEVFTFV